MRQVLLTHTGPRGEVLECVEALEAGYFGDAKAILQAPAIFTYRPCSGRTKLPTRWLTRPGRSPGVGA